MSYQELAARLRYPDDPGLQEVYVQTFEFNPACTLEIGWHLFGENYERGEFLVKMRAELRRYGIEESSELPDHLTHLLALIERMEAGEAEGLVRDYVLPALDKMKLEEGTPYAAVLREIQQKLEAEFGPAKRAVLPILQGVGYE